MSIATKKIRFCEGRAVVSDYCTEELKEDEVLIRSRFSLISIGTELNALTGRLNEPWFYENPGYQLTGDVMEKGANVTGLSIGDRVVTLRNHAGYMVASDKPYDTLRIPDNVSYEEASFVALASVAMHGVRKADIKLGESVAIFGMGIVGNVAVQLAKLNGARPVIAIDLSDYRLELAKEAGADYVINPSKCDLKEEIDRITGNGGIQVIIEATGNARVIDMAFRIASLGGRIVVVGAMPGVETSLNLHRDFLGKELSLIAAAQFCNPIVNTIYYHFTQQVNRKMLLDMIGSGEINVKRMITHRFSYEKAPEVYEFLKGSKDADEKFMDPEELRKMVGVIFEWK